MTGFVFVVIFGLNCLLVPCEGIVSAPSDGIKMILASKSTKRIVWSFDDQIQSSTTRLWLFTPRYGLSVPVTLASTYGFGDVFIHSNIIQFAVEKPATLVLKKVDSSYDGEYLFGLTSPGRYSYVTVSITVTPVVKVDCVSPSTVNVGDDFVCVCTASRDNPLPSVTWYKGKKAIGEPAKEKQTLRLNNVARDDAGIYRCEAKSREVGMNKTEVELIVKSPLERYPTTLSSEKVVKTRREDDKTESGTTKESTADSDTNAAVVIGIAVAVTLVIVMLSILVYHLWKGKRGNADGAQPATHVQVQAPDIQSSEGVYDDRAQNGEVPDRSREPNRALPPLPDVRGAYENAALKMTPMPGYEKPADYAHLDSSRRVPTDGNYQGLNAHYTHLDKSLYDDVQDYASLNTNSDSINNVPQELE